MATYEEVINGNINSLKELKDLVKAFKDELATAKEGTKEWEDACEGLAVAQGRVDQINRAAKGTLNEYNNSAKDSINTLKARIKELNTERNAMDMNSQEYADATATLKELNTRLRESGTAAGDMKANVGNYAESLAAGFQGVSNAVGQASSQMVSAIGGLGQSLGGLSPVLGTATTGMQGLAAAAGPVGIALAAIAAVLAAFKQGIESSESNTNKFKEALAPLQAVLVLLQRAIQDITGKVLDWMIALRENERFMKALHTVSQAVVTVFLMMKQRVEDMISVFTKWYGKIKEIASKVWDVFKPVVETITKVFDVVKNKLEPVINWIIDKWNWLAKTDIGKLFGLKAVGDAAEAWKEAGEVVDEFGRKVEETEAKVKQNLQDEIALQQRKRELLIANAQIQGELAAKELEINEARNEETQDYDRILELINEKTEIQLRLAQNDIELKAAELALIRQRNAMSDTDTAGKDAEAQAAAALTQAQNALTQAQAAGEAEKRRILKAKRSQEMTAATKELTNALTELENQYNKTMSNLELPEKPEYFSSEEEISTYFEGLRGYYQADYEAYSAMTEQKIEALRKYLENENLTAEERKAKETEIDKMQIALTKKYKEYSKQRQDAEKAENKADKAFWNARLDAFAGLMDAMSGLFEENTIAFKLTATAKALIDTYLAANEVLASQPGGYIAKAAAMAATIATGIANVIAIWKTDTKNPSVSNSSSSSNATAVPQVDNTPYTYARTVQTVAAEETLNQAGEPTKVYVLESDITDAQNRSKVRVAESEW